MWTRLVCEKLQFPLLTGFLALHSFTSKFSLSLFILIIPFRFKYCITPLVIEHKQKIKMGSHLISHLYLLNIRSKQAEQK